MGVSKKKIIKYKKDKDKIGMNSAETQGGQAIFIINLNKIFDDPENDGMITFTGECFKGMEIGIKLETWIANKLLPALKASNIS